MPNIELTRWRNLLPAFVLAILLSTASQLIAEDAVLPDFLGTKSRQKNSASPVEFEATLSPSTAQPGDEVTLTISAKLLPEHYVYSTSRNNGAETKISILRASGLTPVDESFQSDHPPKIAEEVGLDEKTVKVEKFYEHVAWSRRYRVAADTSLHSVSLDGNIKYQVCSERECQRPDPFKFQVKLETAAAEARPALTTVGAEEQDQAVRPPEGNTKFEQKVGSKGNKKVAATWKVSITPSQAKPGDDVTLSIEVNLKPGWHVYAIDQHTLANGEGPLRTGIKFEEFGDLQPQGQSFTTGPAIEKASEAWDGLTERYHEGQVVWTRQFKLPGTAEPGNIPLSGHVAYQMCNSGGCQPPIGFKFEGSLIVAQATVDAPLSLFLSGPLNASQAIKLIESVPAILDGAKAPNVAGAGHGANAMVVASDNGIDKSQGLMLFLITAVIAGFAALLTPCVFPMIPITISFFQKQSEKEHHRPITMASVYCVGIIGTFTGLGLLMSILFGATAITTLANNAWLNLCIAATLMFFAMNLLGLFEIRIPSWLLTYTSGKESKGGYIGVLFMALTFTLTSFTCTFAFAGLLLAAAAKGDRLWPALGLLAFSAAFSTPFFFLALFPSFLQKLPKSGGWMNVVKVIMGLIEFGAAFKFLSVADLSWHPEAWVFDYELVMSAWMIIAIAAAMYLLNLYRLPHDTPTDHIGVIRFISSLGFMGLAAYLGVGLFATEKPTGKVWKYIVAFAAPRFEGGTDPTGPYLEHGGLKYALDFDRAMEFAIREKLPVFLDFTGVNCTNCRFMEKGPMSQPHVKDRLSKFVRIQLYTDRVPYIQDDAEAERLVEKNRQMQADWFGDVSLPAYAVIPPDPAVLKDPSKIMARFKGAEQRDGSFVQFLDEGLSNWRVEQAKRAANDNLIGSR